VKDVTAFLQHLSAVGFGLVGLFAVIAWMRDRNRGNAYLALALGLLGLVTVIGEVTRDTGLTRPDGTSTAPPLVAAVLALVSLGLFMGCGFALLLFRHVLLPVRREVLAAVGGVMAVVSISFVPISIDPTLGKRFPLLTLGLIILLLLVWAGSVGEPVYRLWRVSRTRPAVQRARLRALAAGYGIIILVLLFAIGVVGSSGGRQTDPNSITALLLQLITLLAIPALYISFAPPRWLRRTWRAGEEEAINDALHDLLLDSPNRRVLADRALSWAVRLVGAEGGVVLDADGTVLTRRDVPDEMVSAMSGGPVPDRSATPTRLPEGHAVIAVPLSLSEGTGRMVVVAGTLTPALGDEESLRLSQYGVSVAAALDRMSLVETVRRSEEELRDVNRDLEDRVRRRTSDLELANRELQASNRELEAFSYTVSHDLRSPLRAIDGFTRILTEEAGEKLEPSARRYLDLVAENAKSMGGLIDTMLTFSRMGRQPLALQKVSPTEIAQRVAERMAVDTEGRNVVFEIQPMPDCESDPVLVEQLFSNLIGNAIKFTRKREEARVTAAAMPDPQAPGVTAYFVRDNGVGFDPRYAHKLFGVFQRLHRAEEYEGFGAGLAIVERIVTRHGGRVWAESQPGEGATFFFTLKPAETGAAPPG
jgi:signal transduction histidine kinase